jgi:hypothetical protein
MMWMKRKDQGLIQPWLGENYDKWKLQGRADYAQLSACRVFVPAGNDVAECRSVCGRDCRSSDCFRHRPNKAKVHDYTKPKRIHHFPTLAEHSERYYSALLRTFGMHQVLLKTKLTICSDECLLNYEKTQAMDDTQSLSRIPDS